MEKEDYYWVAPDGIESLTYDFQKAIEMNMGFKAWVPGMPLPYFDRGSKLQFDGLICNSLFLDPREKWCCLHNCSIGELIVAEMENINSIGSFIDKVLCFCPHFVDNFICNSIEYEGKFCDVIDMGGYNEAVLLRARDVGSYYLNPTFGVEFHPDLQDRISDASLFGSYSSVTLPPLPKHALALTNCFVWACHLDRLNLDNWNTEHIMSFENLFWKCGLLEILDLSTWDVSNVVRMDFMLYECARLESVDMSGWNTRNVAYMDFMFSDCRSLKHLDLSGWDINGNVNVFSMFKNCCSLTALDLSGWNIENMSSTEDMFNGCSNLVVTVDASQINNFNALGYKPEVVTFVTK